MAFAKKLLIGCLSLSLAMPFPLLAQEPQARDKAKRVRVTEVYDAGVLKKGSLVQIPKTFNGRPVQVYTADGHLDFNASLINWSGIPERVDLGNSPETRRHLLPVEVDQNGETKTYYVAREDLRRRFGTNNLVATADTELSRVETSEKMLKADGTYEPAITSSPLTADQVDPANEIKSIEERLKEFQAARIDCNCDDPTPKTAAKTSLQKIPLSQLMLDHALSKGHQALDRKIRTRKQGTATPNQVLSQFMMSCGMKMETFLPEIEKEAKSIGAPPELYLSIMTQESGGSCFAYNGKERGNNKSMGLFQISTASGTKYRRCNTQEQRQIQDSTLAELRSGSPNCVDNPVINLREATRVLSDSINGITKNFNEKLFMGEEGERTFWTMVAAGYNSSPVYSARAKKALYEANKVYGTKFTPYKWNDIRRFYLTDSLSGTARNHIDFDKSGRDIETSALNVSYAEYIFGRGPSTHFEPLYDQWRRTLRLKK